MFIPPYEDPRVSYGFKEMYCDALHYSKDDTTDGKKRIAHSPRLTVFETLNEVLNKNVSVRGNYTVLQLQLQLQLQ